MAKNFGKTWWGEQWLNSLSNIDFSNRLPRGSSYANKGAVKSIDINGNKITAKVQGSQPRPYDVAITVPSFSAAEIKRLTETLSAKPVIISKLLNRELDPEVLQVAAQQGLQVFPRQWNDFAMSCSCPDWAVPCKHLAAVIYKVSAEIDNNPFLVFSLHSVDLVQELKQTGIFIEQQSENQIPFIKDILLTGKKSVKASKTKETPALVEDNIFRTLPFAALLPIQESLIQLLEDHPVFYQHSGNFRDKYAFALRKSTRNMQRIASGKADINDFFPPFKESKQAANHHSYLSVRMDAQNKAVFCIDGKELNTDEAIRLLLAIPIEHAIDYQPEVAALRYVLLAAYNLLANGAVIPQIIRLQDERRGGYYRHSLASGSTEQRGPGYCGKAARRTSLQRALLFRKKGKNGNRRKYGCALAFGFPYRNGFTAIGVGGWRFVY